jgi:1-deoxy-D-xylulose-5-phosphate reductoisomerase
MRGVAILGSTGSIGRSTLAVLGRQREHFRVVALTAGSNCDLLEAQVAEWRPAFAGVVEGARNGFASGARVLVEAATHPDAEIVVNAVVGAAGLDATLAALRAGKRVALANKETLVTAGDLVLRAAREGGGELQRGAPVPHRVGRRRAPAHPHRLRRSVPGVAGGAGGGGHRRGGAPAPDVAHGPEGHGGQRHAGQQGPGADRGAPPLRAPL